MDSTQKAIIIAAILSPITYPIGFVKHVWGKIFPSPMYKTSSKIKIPKKKS